MPRSVLQFQLPADWYFSSTGEEILDFKISLPPVTASKKVILGKIPFSTDYKEITSFRRFTERVPIPSFNRILPNQSGYERNDSNSYSCNPCRRWYQDNLQSRPGYLQLLELLQYNAPPRQRCIADLCDVYTRARLLIRLSDNSLVPRHDRSTASRCLKVKLLFVR